MANLLTVDEAAAKLHLHPMIVRRHTRQGTLQAVRIGGRIRVREEDLDTFVRPAVPGAQALLAPLKPPSPDELERRRQLFEATIRLREQIGLIGITADELLHLARAEEEASYGKPARLCGRRVRRTKLAP